MWSFCVLNVTLICCLGDTKRYSLMATTDTGYDLKCCLLSQQSS